MQGVAIENSPKGRFPLKFGKNLEILGLLLCGKIGIVSGLLKFKIFPWQTLIPCLFLVACGNFELAGKPSGSETTNSIAVRVIDSRGVAVSGAQVLVLDNVNWFASVLQGTSPVRQVLETDAHGEAQMQVPTNYNPFFSVTMGRYVALLPWNVGDSSIQLVLEAGFALSGCVDSIAKTSGVENLKARVVGTPYTASLDSLGCFSFLTIPPGNAQVVFTDSLDRLAWGKTVVGVGGQLLTLASLPLRWDWFLVDDFDMGGRRMPMGDFTGQGWWYIWLNSGVNLDFPLPDSSGRYYAETALVEENSQSGKSLLLNYSITGDGAYLHFGVKLAAGPFDLSNLRAIRFVLGGNAQAVVRLVDGADGSLYAPLPVAFQQDSWQQVTIPRDSLRLNPSRTGQTADELLGEVMELRFMITGGSQFRLDEIWLEGISLPQVP